MNPASHPLTLRVQTALGPRFVVLEFEASTRTSVDAAAAVGCEVAQIAKSIIFKTAAGARPVLVVASGTNRVDDKKVTALIGEKVRSADADYVRLQTGFVIGGVPPVGHDVPPLTLIDQDLLPFTEIWAAAGTPNAVFKLSPSDLVKLTGGKVGDVAKLQAVLP